MFLKKFFLNSKIISNGARSVCIQAVSNKHTSSKTHCKLNGIFPPIATPFEKDQSVSYEKMKHNLGIWNKIPFAGYVVQGSNGEYPYLTPDERIEVVRQVKEDIPENKLLIAGSGCESTLSTIEMTNAMADNGADAVLVVTPCFYKNQMSAGSLLEHYETVADNSKVPVIIYNMPANTGINVPIDTIVTLSQHPNIIGIKESGGDITRIGLTVHLTKNSNNFQVIAGSASFLLGSYAVGAVGGVCALANVIGNEVCQLHKLFQDKDLSQAAELQRRLIAPNAAVTSKYGVPGLKAAMELFGLQGGRPRLPLQRLDEAAKSDLKKAFQENGFL